MIGKRDNEKSRRDADFFDHPAYTYYMRMGKSFVDDRAVGDLLLIRDALAEEESRIEYLTVAGWASAEAALVATDRLQEERHDYLDDAADLWQRASDAQHARNTYRGISNDYFNENFARLKLVEVFVPLMHAMVDGDVTKEVRDQLYDNLLYLAAMNASVIQDVTEIGLSAETHVGLAHEINAMLAVNRLHSPTLIATPATARAGSGAYWSSDTHDIDLLHLQWGQITGVTTLESKAHPTESHYGRYRAAIVNGKIHLDRQNSDSPVDTVLLFMKEREGTLTQSETQELDTMTDTIVHLARHQLYASADIPLHCRDVEGCEVIPKHRSVQMPLRMGQLAVAS